MYTYIATQYCLADLLVVLFDGVVVHASGHADSQLLLGSGQPSYPLHNEVVAGEGVCMLGGWTMEEGKEVKGGTKGGDKGRGGGEEEKRRGKKIQYACPD